MEFQRHTCPSCGAHIEIDPHAANATCEYCGQGFSLRAQASASGAGASRACLSCGYANATDSRYCNDCGASLGGSDRLPQMTIEVEAPPPQAGQRKVCPFCKEDIAAAAIKCKHCNEYLDGRARAAPRAAAAAPRLSTAEIARTWSERFFQDCPYTLAQLKPWSAYGPDKVKGIAKALKLQAGENGLAVLNETFWGSGKRGVVLTDQRVVWRIGRNKGDVSLSYLNRVEHQYGWFKPKKLWFNKHELDPTYATKDDLEALAELLQRIVSDRVNRGISPTQQRQQQRRNWGVAMLQRIAAPAQSGGAKGSSFGLGCLLMVGFCCVLPGIFGSSAGRKVSKEIKNAQKRAQKASRDRAKKMGREHMERAQAAAAKDPVQAWSEASAAVREFGRARDTTSIHAKHAKRFLGEQGVLAAPILLKRGLNRLRSNPKEAAKLLKQAQLAHADGRKAGKPPAVSGEEIEAGVVRAEVLVLGAELERLRGLIAKQDRLVLERGLKAMDRKLSKLKRRLKNPAAIQSLEAKLNALRAEVKASSADASQLRGPKPKVGFRGGVRATERALSQRYPGWRPKRWSKLVGVGPHWVVDVELATGSRKGRRTRRKPRRIVQLRVWIQQGKVTDVRELTTGQFGRLKQ